MEQNLYPTQEAQRENGVAQQILIPDDVPEDDDFIGKVEKLGFEYMGISAPSNLDVMENAVQTLLQEPLDADAMNHVLNIDNGTAVTSLARGYFDVNSSDYDDDAIASYIKIIRGRIDYPKVFDEQRITWPNAKLPKPKIFKLPESVANNSMVIIGDGPAAILMARMRHELGYKPDATRVIGKAGETGGIWNHARVVDEGHNTIAQAQAFGAVLRVDTGRKGPDLTKFLKDIAAPIQPNLHKGNVDEVMYDPESKRYAVHYKVGQITHVAHADSVCICTGTGTPAPLSSHIMKTNAADLDGLGINRFMKRWQEQLGTTEEAMEKYNNKSPLIVGLGNSAIGVIRQLKNLVENHDADIHPKILTHHSRQTLADPEHVRVRREDNQINEPLQRTRSDLTKLALDLGGVKDAFDFAMDNGWIIDSVTEWNVNRNVLAYQNELKVTVQTRRAIKHIIHPTSIHALIGYRNNPAFMRKLGAADVSDEGYIGYEQFTHRVKTNFQDDPKRLYALGAAASLPRNRNEEVIPGMMRAVTQIAFSELVSAFRPIAAEQKVRDSLKKMVDDMNMADVARILREHEKKMKPHNTVVTTDLDRILTEQPEGEGLRNSNSLQFNAEREGQPSAIESVIEQTRQAIRDSGR